jgi:serine/threonine-protein kinase
VAFSPGDRLGAYEILSPLGAGGMGVVYRARDTKLGRDVAIKTLPDDVAADGDRRSRFEREARALAALAHPNIASIFGFEQAGAAHLLVMELVEGETLADWIARGPIAVERAIPLFLQIAAGLEAAHAKGIVHRDLKPANIKIAASATSSSREIKPGAVKILDFGLAKALAPASGAPAASESHSPTLTLQATMRGELLGTAAYMSPEQAQGEPADERADIWAFGVCLLETLTGRRVFKGANASLVLASVLKDEPDLSALPPAAPAPLRRLLRRCLEKDRDKRLHDIADARLELEEAMVAPAADPEPVAAVHRGARPLWIAITAAAFGLGVAASILVAGWLRPAPEPVPIVRSVLEAPSKVSTSLPHNMAIARDASVVVYDTGDDPRTTTIRARRLDQLEGAPLRGLEPGASQPFLSPDDRWVGYFDWAGWTLRKISILGGSSVALCKIAQFPGMSLFPIGASWGPDDTIVFGQQGGPLRRVPAAGGEPEDLTQLAKGEVAHRYPEFLPGGEALLFAAFEGNDPNAAAIHALSLSTGERKVVLRGATQPRYVSSGHLIYAVGTTLYAVAFDPRGLKVDGDPMPVVEGVSASLMGGPRHYAVSAGGALVYVSGGADSRHALVWVDREGREEPIGAPPRLYVYARLSPDGSRIALDVREGTEDIWIWNLERETLTRLTSSPRADIAPVWSPDGRTVFFASLQENGDYELAGRVADGAGEPMRLTRQRNLLVPMSVAPDGAGLVVSSADDLLWIDTAGGVEPRALFHAGLNLFTNAEVSPDGRWLAYESNESGTSEVFVRPFPALDSGRWPVSTGGGTRPLWSHDGREMFYLDASGFLTAVAVERVENGLNIGRPEVVIRKAYVNARPSRTYDVSPDGRRFLMIKEVTPEQDAADGKIVLVQNWLEELRRLAPPRR